MVEGKGRVSIHIDEVVEAFLLATLNERAFGPVFNLSNPRTSLTDLELYDFLIELTGSTSKIKRVADQGATGLAYQSLEKAHKLLGWQPQGTIANFKRAVAADVRRMHGK